MKLNLIYRSWYKLRKEKKRLLTELKRLYKLDPNSEAFKSIEMSYFTMSKICEDHEIYLSCTYGESIFTKLENLKEAI